MRTTSHGPNRALRRCLGIPPSRRFFDDWRSRHGSIGIDPSVFIDRSIEELILAHDGFDAGAMGIISVLNQPRADWNEADMVLRTIIRTADPIDRSD